MASNFFAETKVFAEAKISQVFAIKTSLGRDLLKVTMATEGDAKKVLAKKSSLRFQPDFKHIVIFQDRPPHERMYRREGRRWVYHTSYSSAIP